MTLTVSHDKLLKNLIKTFLPDFLYLIAPEVIPDLDLQRPTWIDKEAFADLFQGTRATFDLLAQLDRRAPPPAAALVHIEIESQFRSAMESRVQTYYFYLRLHHQLPVIPLVLYLRGGPAGAHRHHVREFAGNREIFHFSYWALHVAGCTAEDYLQRSQPLAWALAALMKPASLTRVELKIECLRKIARSKLDDARQAILVNAVLTYLQLSPDEEVAYMQLLQQEANTEVRDLELTWFERVESLGHDRGVEEGRQEGRQEGLVDGSRSVVRTLLAEKFGPLPPTAERRLAALRNVEELNLLSRRLLHASSLEDLGLS